MPRRPRISPVRIVAALGALVLVVAVVAGGLGYSLLVFRSGSMAPAIDTGALAVARSTPADELAVGDVVTVDTLSGGRVTHRIVDVVSTDRGASLLLKGDANPGPDEARYAVTSAPKVVASVPVVGRVVVVVFSWPVLLAAAGVAALLVVRGVRRARTSRESVQSPAGSGRRPVVLAALGTLVLASGVSITDAAFTDTGTVTASATSAPYFTCANAMAALDPWAYYEFDESAPTLNLFAQDAADSSGDGRTARYRPNYLLVNPPYVLGQTRACQRDGGTAVRFNGSSSYVSSNVSVANANGAAGARWNTFTLSVWFKSTSAASSGNLISLGSSQTGASTQHDRHIYLSSAGNIVFGVYPGTVREVATTGTDYSDTQWHMATASLSSQGMKLYVDGQLIGSRTDTTTAEQFATSYWRIGYDTVQGWGQATGDFFAGTMDEVGIWTRALTDAEVLALYRSAKPNP